LPCLETISMASWSSLTFLISGKSSLRASLAVIDMKAALRKSYQIQYHLIGHWLDGAATPLARVLDKLTPVEQETFLKAMDLLETELRREDADS
jgi:hypothetical protein